MMLSLQALLKKVNEYHRDLVLKGKCLFEDQTTLTDHVKNNYVCVCICCLSYLCCLF
jgi:hypothetical protein